MGLSANVQSIQALRDFRMALCRFVDAARSSLGEADADLQRHVGWMSEDRQKYWASELRRRTEQFQRAKLTLLEKKLQKTGTGGHPSTVDEEKALTMAQRALEEAQRKAEHTKRWMRRLEEQVLQHKGLLNGLHYTLDNDVVATLAQLDRMIDALDRYIAVAPPPGIEPEAVTSEAGGMARPADTLVEEQDEEAKRQAYTIKTDSSEPAPQEPEQAETTPPEDHP